MNNILNEEIQKELKPEIKGILKNIFGSKYSRFIKKPVVILLLIESLFGWVFTGSGIIKISLNTKFLWNSNMNSSQVVQQIGNNNQVSVLSAQTQCSFRYCSDFRDGKWKNIDQFDFIQQYPLILKSPNNPIKPGATAFFDQDVGNFTMEAFITPMATSSANLVIAYGNYTRCIIGDGNYQNIACQVNERYPNEPKDWTYFDKDGNLHGRFSQWQTSKFEPNKEIQIRYEYHDSQVNNTISIKINDQVPLIWKIPQKFQGIVKLDKVGLGLFTTRYNDVQAVFKSFQLDPNI